MTAKKKVRKPNDLILSDQSIGSINKCKYKQILKDLQEDQYKQIKREYGDAMGDEWCRNYAGLVPFSSLIIAESCGCKKCLSLLDLLAKGGK